MSEIITTYPDDPSDPTLWGFEFDGGQVLADVKLAHGVVLQLVREKDREWEVWAVEVDGHLYRDPRDLEGEPLRDGPFARRLDTTCRKARRKLASEAA